MYWLSFCDPEKAPGTAFLGVAIVDGSDLETAVENAWKTGVNPGGEVLAMRLPSEVHDLARPNIGRLLTSEEAEALSREMDAKVSPLH